MSSSPRTTDRVRGHSRQVSRRLVSSYVTDWIVILATAGVGGAFSKLKPNQHPFSLFDPSISFPYKEHDTVTTTTLLLVSIVAPVVIISIICLLFVPGPTAARGTPQALIWRRKLWELNTSFMGLGVALAGAFMVTEGMKDLYGKPRPDLIARCNPDLSNIGAHQVGGLGGLLDEGPILVTVSICRNQTSAVTHSGFSSFPSGHSSFSWAGMTYLTLFLCSKFAIAVPFLAPRAFSKSFSSSATAFPRQAHDCRSSDGSDPTPPPRNQAAAPPTFLLILAFVPIGAAIYIASTRWADFRHHGFDIISGSLLGFGFAWLGFRWYHLPVRQGAGWSWGARSRERAFYVGIGIPTYVGDEGWSSSRVNGGDVESQGDGIMGGGAPDRGDPGELNRST